MALANKILAKILPDYFTGCLNQRFPEWPAVVRKREIRARLWLKELVSELIKLSFLAVIVCLVYIAFLYFLRGSWHIFADTAIGNRYVNSVNIEGAAEIAAFISLEFKSLGVIIILLTVQMAVVVGVISQLTMLRRFFYVGRSTLVKLGWVAGVSAAVAHRLVGHYPMEFYLSFGLCFLPTLGILSPVLASAGKLLPELNLLLFLEKRRERREVQNLKDDIALLMNDDSGEDFDQ